MNENGLQRVYNNQIYPRDSKIFYDRGFVNIDKSSQGGTQWNCFVVKDNKSFYFDSFGIHPDKFLFNELPKPTINHKYKTQETNFKLFILSYCLHFSI